MTLSQAILLFLEARRNIVARQTLRNNEMYLRSLMPLLGEIEIAAVTIEQLRAWRDALYARTVKYTDHKSVRKPVAGKLSVYTIRGHVEVVRQLFNWLVNEEHLLKSPAKRLEVPALPDAPPRTISECDLDLLLAEAHKIKGLYRRKRNVALLLFLRDTGARVGGASTLRFEHLDLERRRALVTEKGRGGGRTRAVFLKMEAVKALQEWLCVHPKNRPRKAVRKKGLPQQASEFVFVGERYPYARLTPNSIYDVFKALKKKAGITGRTNPHSLRHRRAKSLLLNGAPLGLVSRILGHTDVRITDKSYGVYATEELKEGFDKYA